LARHLLSYLSVGGSYYQVDMWKFGKAGQNATPSQRRSFPNSFFRSPGLRRLRACLRPGASPQFTGV